jgi:uncharacterized C2H2 Zn-finger protein
METAELAERSVQLVEPTPYVTCPLCPTIFKEIEGWAHHMRVDHWWELDESDASF